MHKIYSRKRLILPNFKYTQKLTKNTNKIKKIFSVFFIAFLVLIISWKAVNPVFYTICREKAKSTATVISNEEATAVMKKYNYEDLFSIEKDNKGNITMIKSNIFPINEIISTIPLKIQERINQKGRDNIKIALGTFSGLKILSRKRT